MAIVLPSIAKVGGRTIYRYKGRFISRSTYESLMRRSPISGQFMSAAGAARERGIEQYLRSQLGAPPSGKNWISIASKYAERFQDYLEELQ